MTSFTINEIENREEKLQKIIALQLYPVGDNDQYSFISYLWYIYDFSFCTFYTNIIINENISITNFKIFRNIMMDISQVDE